MGMQPGTGGAHILALLPTNSATSPFPRLLLLTEFPRPGTRREASIEVGTWLNTQIV